jgi:DNA-binding NtrC family response regulator
MNDVRNRILIIDDTAEIRVGVQMLLADTWDVQTAENGVEGLKLLESFSPDVVLLDVILPDSNGVDLLHQIRMMAEATAVIMMSGSGKLEYVIESMKLGAETFLQKPFDYAALTATLEQALRMVRLRRELTALRRNEGRGEERLPGMSPAIAHLNDILDHIARAPSPVLIEGESGTGKGVLARLIHNRSPRSRAPFVDLNCAGLSKELLESELFGHERGAFTNAANTKPGLFEIAGEGTLFLDEIGEMELTVQARMLKALEEKRFRRVGGIRDLRADFRLLAATNRDLTREVAEGRFRGDLYYRLNVVRLRMPALRERLEDLPILAETLLRTLAKEIKRPVPKISPTALKKLTGYPWPGNIRELRNVLERGLLTLRGDELRSEDLAVDSATAVVAPKAGAVLPTEEWEIRPLDEIVTQYVAAAVEAADRNVRLAARRLRVSPSTIYAKIGKKGDASSG